MLTPVPFVTVGFKTSRREDLGSTAKAMVAEGEVLREFLQD